MAGRKASNTLTRYAGIQVQTSSLGLQIPVGWGTFRCRCNLVDYLDFKSTAQKAASGKGGVTTGYSYSATIILALCEGSIDQVTQVWVDSKTYAYESNGSTVADTAQASAMSQCGLTLAHGTIGQAPWSYLASAHPTHAIGYSGLAIGFAEHYALDSGASPPSHSFEVVRQAGFAVSGGYTGPDIDPSLMIADFFQNARTGVPSWPANGLLDPVTLTTAPSSYQKYCIASGLLLSPIIDEERSASDALTEYLLATNSTCVWSEGLLKFIPYGDTAVTGNGVTYTPSLTPVYSLDDDDYIVKAEGDDPITVDIEDQSDAYNVVQLEYLDRSNQYNMAIALASDAANVVQYGARRQDPTTVHCVCTPAVAAVTAQLYLQRTLYIRGKYKFKLGWMFALLEPGDLLELNDVGLGLDGYMVRITQIDEDDKDATLDITCEDLLVGVSNAPLYATQGGQGTQTNHSVDPGGVEANLLLYSDSPANAAWTKTNASIVADATTDQYGLSLASTIVATAGAGVHGIAQSIAAFSGLNYTGAVCLQKNVRKNARVTLSDGAGNGAYIEVDTNAGAILTPATAIGTGAAVAGLLNATLVAGIWQVVLTVRVAATTLVMEVDVNSDANANSWTAAGEGALYVSQLQLTQGLATATYAATQGAVAGPRLFNPPSVLTPGQNAGSVWAAVAGGPNWGGANVWTSVDGVNYQQIGAVDGAARFGVSTASLPNHADPDTADALAVDLGASNGALTSASDATADNGGTLCLIDNELVCFSTATLTNPARYSLTGYLRRGFLNTAVAAHGAGAVFIRLDDGIFDFPYNAANIGTPFYVKFQSFNLYGQATQSLADCNVCTVTPSVAPAAAPAPAAWTAVGGSITLAGASVPALIVTGAFDNPSASGVIVYYRVTGASTWIAATTLPTGSTSYDVTSVVSGQSYDVGVANVVNGTPTPITQIASAITVGTASAGLVLPASESIAAGALCNIWNDAGVATLRNADQTNTGKAADVFVLSAVTSGHSATAYAPGSIVTGLAGLTPGTSYFLGASGAVTSTAPSTSGYVSQPVGKALTATTLLFAPGVPNEL